MLQTANCKFTRIINWVPGSNNRASTDAINALEQWKASVSSREYKILQDDDEFIIANIEFSSSDRNAGDDMASACRQYSIHREITI